MLARGTLSLMDDEVKVTYRVPRTLRTQAKAAAIELGTSLQDIVLYAFRRTVQAALDKKVKEKTS